MALTDEPTATPTEEPTVAPTDEPTAVATDEPTAAPTEEPTVAPTEAPTAQPEALAIDSVTPNQGPSDGATTVTIYGSGFDQGARVSFGSLPASNVELISSGELRAVAPAFIPGLVNVTVTSDGESAQALDAYTYVSDQAYVGLPTKRYKSGWDVDYFIEGDLLPGLTEAEITLSFDPTVVRLLDVQTMGPSVGWNLSYDGSQTGQVSISMDGLQAPIYGYADFINVRFEVIGKRRSKTNIVAESMLFNGGSIPVSANVGVISVR